MDMELKPATLTMRHVYFGALVVLSAVVFHRALGVVVGSSLSDENYGHILLVWPISAVLLYFAGKKILAKTSYSWVGGVTLLILAGCSAFVLAHASSMGESAYLSLSILLFVGWCLAAFLLCYGTAAFRAGAFPLLFLLLTVPVPDFLLQPTITMLQDRSGDATCFLYRVAHVPYVRHGIVVSLAKLDIQIAEECSGIRSTMVLFLTSLVLAHLYLKSAWSKALLTLAVLPITIAKNGLRIFALSTLGTYWDPSFLTGRLHHQGGFIFFALAFGALLLLIWIMQKFETGHRPVHTGAPASEPVLKGSL
jgi:exosortase